MLCSHVLLHGSVGHLQTLYLPGFGGQGRGRADSKALYSIGDMWMLDLHTGCLAKTRGKMLSFSGFSTSEGHLDLTTPKSSVLSVRQFS